MIKYIQLINLNKISRYSLDTRNTIMMLTGTSDEWWRLREQDSTPKEYLVWLHQRLRMHR